jgi:Flp pilus assembly pilin Flp
MATCTQLQLSKRVPGTTVAFVEHRDAAGAASGCKPQYAAGTPRTASRILRCNREDRMNRLVRFVKSLRRREEGQDLLEYALLVALIALGAVLAVTLAGDQVEAIFTMIAAELAKAVAAA